MFKCRNSQTCIHVGDICNGQKDCTAGDDEFMCSLTGLLCLSSCLCLGSAIKCYNVSAENYLTSASPYTALFISHCDNAFLELLFKILKPIVLSLTYNNIKSACKILPGLDKMLKIDLGFNNIEHVNQDCFKYGFQIISIKLNDNLISIFYKAVLFQLINLKYLDLSNNFIIKLFSDSHVIASYLEVLSIKNNTLTAISDRIFNNFNLKILITNKYFICCKLPSYSICTSVRPWFESCNNLLLQRSITVYVFCYSILIIFSNVSAAFVQKMSCMRSKDNSGTFQYIVISVNFIDLTWGIYLIFLVVFDLIFEENFVLQESLWKSSLFCYFLFSINLNYNILSPLFSSFIALSRLMVVMYPLNSNFTKRKFVLKYLILIYSLATTLEMGFIVTFMHLYSKVPFRICSPFIDPTHSTMMLTVATFVVVCFQFIVYFLNIILSRKTVLELKGSKGKVQFKGNHDHTVVSLLKQFYILTLSSTLSWIPNGIILVICMFIEAYSIVIVTWVVLTVSSINSVTNPIVFIVTTTRKWK